MDLFESVPNFSEGRDADAIAAIAAAASGAYVLDTDPDPNHHRTVISLAGGRERLVQGLVDCARTAVERLDLRSHMGVHPRVGAVDVVPVVPLGATTLDKCRDVARELGERLWSGLGVPVYFYGHGEPWTLADIRAGRARPDLGGPDLHPSAGAVCVGARRALVAFNVVLPEIGVADARALARSLRETAGGMRGVMALIFELPGGRIQLSMNLVRLEETTPDDVLRELDRRGVRFEEAEVVGLCPAAAATPAAAGRVLEARIGEAVAREGSRRCRERGGEEHDALAGRLAAEADGLHTVGLGQDDLLAAAERCAALAPVLAAAGVLDDELDGLARVAAAGLRAAVSRETEQAYAARIAALERRLGT